MSDIVKKLGSLSLVKRGSSSKSPASKSGMSKATNFFSLPGELRNQIYRYYANDLKPTARAYSVGDMYWGFDIRRHNDDNALAPELPALMQTSRQTRLEFSRFYKQTFDLKCNDYHSFRAWTQGIGASVIGKLGELHLTIKVNVNLVNRNPPSNRLTTTNLRVRFNSARDLGIEREGPAARFWFDMVDDPNPDSLEPNFDRMNYNDDSRLWTFTPSCVDRMSREFETRLRWNRQVNAIDVLRLIEWLSGDGLISFHGPSDKPIRNKNTFKIKDEGGRRRLMAMQYPPGSCEYCTIASILWDKPVQIPGVGSNSS